MEYCVEFSVEAGVVGLDDPLVEFDGSLIELELSPSEEYVTELVLFTDDKLVSFTDDEPAAAEDVVLFAEDAVLLAAGEAFIK